VSVGGGGDAEAFGGDSDVGGGSGQFQERRLDDLREAGGGHQPTPQFPPKPILLLISFNFSPRNNKLIILINQYFFPPSLLIPLA